MSTIRTVYHGVEPNFPATDQHPDAVRYRIGEMFVDAIGEPTAEEVAAFIGTKPDPLTLEIDAEIRALESGQDARTVRAAILGDPAARAKLQAIEDAIVQKMAARPE